MSLVYAEYLKLTRRKLYPIMTIILMLFVGVMLFFTFFFDRLMPEDIAGVMPVVEKPEAYFTAIQAVVGQTWFPLILAVVMLGSEFGGTVWAAALTRDSRKLHHIAARLFVLTLASTIVMAVAIAGGAILVALAVPGYGAPSALEWLTVLGKVGLIQLTWIAIGLALVALFRSVGPAIGVALAFVFVLDPLLGMWDRYETISISAATTALFPVAFPEELMAFAPPGLGFSMLHAIAIMVGWAAASFFVAWLALRRRDA